MAGFRYACLVFVLACTCARAARHIEDTIGRDRVQVDFYGESLCPFCANFTVTVLKQLSENRILALADLTYIPYGNAHFNSSSDSYTCQHGPRECELNIVLGCAIHLYQSNWFPFVECVEGEALQERDTAALVGKCADKGDYRAEDISACAAGDLGHELQRAAMKQTQSLRPPHQYVPWVVVNGVPLGSDDQNIGSYICAAFQGSKPDACYELPEPSGTAAWLPAQRSVQGDGALAAN